MNVLMGLEGYQKSLVIGDFFFCYIFLRCDIKGFKGFFPTFRRFNSDCIHIITFQFTAFDRAFCVNIAKSPAGGIIFKSGEYISAQSITTYHCPKTLSLGVTGKHISHWFKYNPTPHEIKMKDSFPFLTMYTNSLLKYKNIADDIIALLDSQGEHWWATSEEWWLSQTPNYNGLFLAIHNSIDAILAKKH